jgi:oligopeptidase B
MEIQSNFLPLYLLISGLDLCPLNILHPHCFAFFFPQVLGGFDASNYGTERKWAVASDGTRIPISILYRKNQVKLDGSDPLLLYGYGSYEICIEPDFRRERLSLVDRGFIYAIAHIRGGGEMGRKWYENGKLTNKKNTFTDFIACAEYLIENNYGSRKKLCINGRSAGGLLISAVLNMRPDLFKAAILGVPFVDVLTTMLDPTIPLTTSEWEVTFILFSNFILVVHFFNGTDTFYVLNCCLIL